MLTEDEKQLLEHLCKENDDLAHLIHRIQEEDELLLSSITHEVRNPLTLIYSTLQLMQARNPHLTTIKYWEQLLMDVKNLSDLLNELTAYNHSASLNFEPLNLYDLLSGIKASFEPVANQKNISFGMEATAYPVSEAGTILCDANKLKQVFINLLKNAFEATPDNGVVHILIHTINKKNQKADSPTNNKTSGSQLSEDDTYEIAISNSGPCIPEDKLPLIFDPFVSTKPEGNGLGLAIVQRIIHAHKGSIQVSSKDNLTSFIIHIPITQSEAEGVVA